MNNNTPTVYVYREDILTEEEALLFIESHLGESCGDIALDLELIAYSEILRG